jgi:hypothetical protein
MSILLPNLDDRRWADLVEQGRALIPLYAPEWTDHNASDPGITLMELLAWIAETDVYRLNRITGREQRQLLQLMSIRPEPPRPSRVVVEARVVSGPSPVTLPQSLEWTGTSLDGRQVGFRSTAAIEIVAGHLTSVQWKAGNAFHSATAAWTRGDTIPVFGDDPVPGAELYLGFDQLLPVNHWTQLYFHFAGLKAGFDERQRVLAGTTGSVPAHHSVRTAWECLVDQGGTARWQPLESDDGTRSFTLNGPVRLKPSEAMTAQAIGHVAQPGYYVRCRFVEGAYDEAPRADRVLLNGVELIQSVPVWQTWPIAPGVAVSGSVTPGETVRLQLEMEQGTISKLTITPIPPGPGPSNEPAFLILGYVPPSAGVAGSITPQAALAGRGTGEPEQTITLARRPAVEHTIGLYSLEGTTWRAWERVDDFAGSSRADAHFRFDPVEGELIFGDGERGRTPPGGCLLFAFYETTLAEAGAGQVSAIADSPLNRVLLPDPGVIGRVSIGQQILSLAGQPAETLAHGIGRAIESREARLRAVTVEDFEAIARETPGTAIARAVARPNLYPGLDCVSAPGVVTVVVVPWLPAGRPTPSAGLIARVAAHLESRRTIGTRVIVTWARYTEVSVRARVRAFDGVDKVRLAQDIGAALDAFLHPLTGGPDGTGWPLGRDVFRSEVLQVIDETAGVDHVLSLELVAEGCAPTCGNVCLRPTWLVAAGEHQMEVL